MNNFAATQTNDQYSLAKILGIWLLAAVPMGILGWIIAPALAPDITEDPIGAAVIRVGMLTVGLVWQFVLSMIIVQREEGNLRWSTIRQRFWLNKPRDPQTSEPRNLLWLWVVPLLALVALSDIILAPMLDHFWVSLFPFFAEPSSFALGSVLESPEIQAQLVGAWGFLGLFFVNAVFNTLLGNGLPCKVWLPNDSQDRVGSCDTRQWWAGCVSAVRLAPGTSPQSTPTPPIENKKKRS